MLEIRPWDVRGVHGLRGNDALSREVDSGEVGEGSGRADELCSAPVAARKLGADAVTHEPAKLAHLFRGDAGLEVILGESNHTKGERAQSLDDPLGDSYAF